MCTKKLTRFVQSNKNYKIYMNELNKKCTESSIKGHKRRSEKIDLDGKAEFHKNIKLIQSQ